MRTGFIRVHSGQESRTAPDRALEERAYSYVLDDLDNLFAQIKREKGRLDIVYADAGGGSFAPIGGITEQRFDPTFDRNVKGTLFTVQKVLPLGPDGGSIIMTASTAGSTAVPAFSVYSASKAAIRSFARCRTLDLNDREIRLNVVSPGLIETPGIAGLAPKEEQRKRLYSMLASISAERAGDFMFRPTGKHRSGWLLEPAYDYSFAGGHQQSVGMNGGLLIGIP